MSGRQHGWRDNASAGPTRRGQKGPHARTETSCARTGRSGNRLLHGAVGRDGKAGGRTPKMNDSRKSDGVVAPTKSANFAGRPASESMEGRTPTKEHAKEQRAFRTQSRADAESALDRVRQAARRDKKAKFTALMHHVTLDRLPAAFLAMNKNAAAGIDGVPWAQYEQNLEENLRDLLDRVHRGAYRAKPSRRVFIPKADGRQRPRGIATLEDKQDVRRRILGAGNAKRLGRRGRGSEVTLEAFAPAPASLQVSARGGLAGARRRHSRTFRRHRPRLPHSIHRASDRRQAHPAAAGAVAARGRDGSRTADAR